VAAWDTEQHPTFLCICQKITLGNAGKRADKTKIKRTAVVGDTEPTV